MSKLGIAIFSDGTDAIDVDESNAGMIVVVTVVVRPTMLLVECIIETPPF